MWAVNALSFIINRITKINQREHKISISDGQISEAVNDEDDVQTLWFSDRREQRLILEENKEIFGTQNCTRNQEEIPRGLIHRKKVFCSGSKDREIENLVTENTDKVSYKKQQSIPQGAGHSDALIDEARMHSPALEDRRIRTSVTEKTEIVNMNYKKEQSDHLDVLIDEEKVCSPCSVDEEIKTLVKKDIKINDMSHPKSQAAGDLNDSSTKSNVHKVLSVKKNWAITAVQGNRRINDTLNQPTNHTETPNISNVVEILSNSSLVNKKKKIKVVKNGNNFANTIRLRHRTKYVRALDIERSIITDKSYRNCDIDCIIPEAVYKEIQKYLVEPTAKERPSEKVVDKRARKSLAAFLNVPYDEVYLSLEERMYTFNEEKLSILEDSFETLIRKEQKEIYCLICNTKIPDTTQDTYEHIFHIDHINRLQELKSDKKRYKLRKQFIKPLTKDYVLCKCCQISLKDTVASINGHIRSKSHISNVLDCRRKIEEIKTRINQEIMNCWYNIQRYSCVLCEANFNYKLEFLKHVKKKHMSTLEGSVYMFDFCTACLTLWLGFRDSYPAHCNDIIHKYLVKTKMFEIDDLTKNVVDLLNRVDETVDVLFKRTEEVLSDVKTLKQIEMCLKDCLKSSFLDIQIYFFGSRVTGLGFPGSDIDLYIKATLNNEERSKYDKTEANDISISLSCIQCALTERKEDWIVKSVITNSRTPVIKLVYKPTTVDCDISITNSLSVENSKLIRSFNDAYPPCRKLILFLKQWLSLCKLNGKDGITNYALAWCAIFFLQQHETVKLPSVAQLIKEENKSQIINGWETGVAKPKCNVHTDLPIRQLLLELFEYYATFDYRNYIICPLMGKKLEKKDFVKPNVLPVAMRPYIKCIQSSNPEYFRIDSPMCIQDPFDLSHNLTKAVHTFVLKRFIQYCEESALILLKL